MIGIQMGLFYHYFLEDLKETPYSNIKELKPGHYGMLDLKNKSYK